MVVNYLTIKETFIIKRRFETKSTENYSLHAIITVIKDYAISNFPRHDPISHKVEQALDLVDYYKVIDLKTNFKLVIFYLLVNHIEVVVDQKSTEKV